MSWSPRIFVLDNFASDDECAAVVNMTHLTDFFRPSTVNLKEGNRRVLPHTNTNTLGTPDMVHPVARRLSDRVAAMLMLPPGHQEPMHVLHYDVGQYFRGHLDSSANASSFLASRVATVIIYVTDVEEGGLSLAYPVGHCLSVLEQLTSPSRSLQVEAGIRSLNPYDQKDPELQGPLASDSYYDGHDFLRDAGHVNQGVSIDPHKGRAVIWWNRLPGGNLDPRSHHVGCPLVHGEKVVAVFWVHSMDIEDTSARAHRAITLRNAYTGMV
eukprot:gene5553-5531_t